VVGEFAPRLIVRDARLPVRLESVDLRTEVIGHAVQTRVELVFRNPNDRALEGELQFPLRDGQVVTGFALDLNGELRPAVPVDKARGQQVFEDITRARVDPALLEKTQGNNYKLRVYPLPAQGTRRVVLNLSQTLDSVVARGSGKATSTLVLPLQFADKLQRLDVEVLVADTAATAIDVQAPGLGAQAVARRQQGRWAQFSLHQTEVTAAKSLSLRLPAPTSVATGTETVAGNTYFYADVPVTPSAAPRAAPQRIALLWDASGSGASRDHVREFALLDQYFRGLRNVEVTLQAGRDVADAPQRFTVKDGRWDSLRQALEKMPYDGASNAAAFVAPAGHDLALLFSDGLFNWSATGVPATKGSTPLYALSANTGVDAPRLRDLAESVGGEWLDLTSLSSEQAAKALHTRKARLVGLSSVSARDLVTSTPFASAGHLAIAGVLTAPAATVELSFERPDGRIERHQVVVKHRTASELPATIQGKSSMPRQEGAFPVAQRWASLRVAALEADTEAHRGEIRRLGKSFGLVTGETSLIVLDLVADYVRYEIEPPASLRAEYERLMAAGQQQLQRARSNNIERVAKRFAEQVVWWNKSFPKDTPDQQRTPKTEGRVMGGSALQRNETTARPAPTGATPAMASPPAPAPMAAAMADRSRESMSQETEKRKSGPGNGGNAPAPTAIRLTPWQPNSPYARRLREATPETVYQRYLDERPDFTQSTAFYLDSADVLFEKKQPELALRVLSNLAEMNLENRHILRVLGYRLLQAKQARLAIPVFRTVQRLSPNEPQSYRDLGLAHQEAGQWQDATDQLWQVVSRQWDGRFPDIDLTALAELNATVERATRAGSPVRTEAYDARLLRNLPLDLRITLAWDADNTDIDLWVIDPNGEKTYYGHHQSHQGGRISHDVTGGYGPEEFSLRHAKPGKYTVQAQFYGHRQQVVAPATTLMMRLTTGFGRPDQKDELVTLRLAGQSELVTVGSFEVGG
jgi:tetratricopeptide (TPR) repeat protein